jgi:RNA polymerase sigma-70 factor (ECF subfamily)
VLDALIAAGRAAWPGVELAPAVVAERLAHLGDGAVTTHPADLYLAIGLAAGDAAALAAFEARLVPEIDAALARMRLAPAIVDEVRQALRAELLAGVGGGAAIAGYAGRGELAAWLRVSATRRALKILRQTKREVSLDDALLDHWPAATPGPEQRRLRETYTAHLKAALAAAFGELDVRERNVLRQHVLDDLTIDELALIYRVNRSTCARWIADARAALGKATRRRMIERLGARADEVDSILRFLDSDIELSISRILAAA